MASIGTAFAHVKDCFTTYVPDTLILPACQDVNHQWRERQLGPVVTTYLFLQQVAHGNTACTHLRHLSGMPVNPSAYCQARYPAKELARLYGLRWGLEVNPRHLKQTMQMEILGCTTVEGVLKELAVFVGVYHLVRHVMAAAAQRQGVAIERISFIDAWRWLQEAEPIIALPDLVVNPARPGRSEPRVRKRRPKHFPVMKKPRATLRQALLGKRA